jgi:hypothetical protein
LNERRTACILPSFYDFAANDTWLGILGVMPKILNAKDWNLIDKRVPVTFRIGKLASDKTRLMLIDKSNYLELKIMHRRL